MEKPAVTDYSLLPVIRGRWSPRAFSGKRIPDKELYTLFEAARWAPSCFNDQPWYYVFAAREDHGNFNRILDSLVEKNRIWARNASALAISVARKNFSSRERQNQYAFHDMGLSLMSMMLQAISQGIYIHAMAGFSSEIARESLAIPEGYDPVTALAIGYPGDVDDLPEELRDKELEERYRKPLEEFIFKGEWGGGI
ncbi:MAG: nitroreductase family protein [Synergistales bacterium]|nr:nitroreductase family protein [Synergistales bacterium]